MIRVVNKKVEEPKIYKVICDECGNELEYEKGDTYIGALGGRELVCPVCGEKVFVDQPEGIELDSSNIEFPIHFFVPNDDAVDIDNSQIQAWVRECLYKAESDSENWCHYVTGSGNTMVFVHKYENEYALYVTKKYYECSIPRGEL